MKIVELIIDPNDEQSGIDAISLVETLRLNPTSLHFLNKNTNYTLKEINAEKKTASRSCTNSE